MNHLKKYNESFKEPLDPESDLEDFIKKFNITRENDATRRYIKTEIY